MEQAGKVAIFDECLFKWRGDYGSRLDLTALEPGPIRETLLMIRDAKNAALAVASDVPPSSYYFDYTDVSRFNGLAFRAQGISFIAITIGAVDALVTQAANQLAFKQIRDLLETDDDLTVLGPLFWNLGIDFLVSHEYGHHFWGHVKNTDLHPFAEFESARPTDRSPSINPTQIQELVADGFAAFLLATSLFAGPLREEAINRLRIEMKSNEHQDRALAALLIITVGGMFGRSFDQGQGEIVSAYQKRHPPSLFRLASFMDHLILWANNHDLPNLATWLHRTEPLLMMAIKSVKGPSMSTEVKLWRSPEGKSYRSFLTAAVNRVREPDS